ncbi:hypothetical protein E4M16_00675 [Ligilactobacillus ruminis]|nr:hypothetical protein E4M16_00675 [Ligilactobacillus ruminis]
MELQVRIYQISFSRGFEKTMPQIEKPDDLQLIANLIRFFRMHYNYLFMMEISQKVCFYFHVSKLPQIGHCM